VEDYFGIAVGVKLVAEFFQLSSELPIIVDFAIEDDPGGAIPIVNWLLAALDINNRQAAHTQAHWSTKIEAIVIWPAVAYSRGHAAHEFLIDWNIVATNYSYDSTHSQTV
jgi:hypothetical protein